VNSALRLRLRPHGQPGKLIVFCGNDGSGKSTLTQAAVDRVRASGRRALEISVLDDFVRESRDFRRYAWNPPGSSGDVDLLGLSLLCAGNRLQNVRRRVLPELAAGAWVFCDRYVFTTWSEFSAFTRPQIEADVLRAVLELFPAPDLGVLVHADPQTCVSRVRARADEASKKLDVDWYAHIRDVYREVGAQNGFREICSDCEIRECERLLEEYLADVAAGTRQAALAASQSDASFHAEADRRQAPPSHAA
jgi:thymidylate kinase